MNASGPSLLSGSTDDPVLAQADSEIARLWSAILASRWLVIIITGIFLFGGLAYAFLGTKWYRAEVLLAPEKDDSRSGLLSQFGGLASLAGINLDAGSDDVEPIAILKSYGFARSFIADEDLMTVLLANKWDSERKAWKAPQSRWPDERDAIKVFDDDVRQVVEDKKTGLVTLAIEWKDPVLSARWANLLVDRVNTRLQARAVAEAEGNIKFLKAEIAAGDLVPLQQASARLLEIELQRLMLARGKAQYAFRVVDSAHVPKKPVRPQKLVVIALAAIIGFLVSVLLVIARRALVGGGSHRLP